MAAAKEQETERARRIKGLAALINSYEMWLEHRMIVTKDERTQVKAEVARLQQVLGRFLSA